jgi:quercetin dioxygenase-like cupin family protein
MRNSIGLNFFSFIFFILLSSALFAKEINWQDMKDFPPGAKIAVIRGNPAQKGSLIVRIKLPAHYIVPAHSHPFQASAKVVSGVYYIGNGVVADGNTSEAINAGNSFVIPANNKHYGCTKQSGAVLEIEAVGPWNIMYSANG